MTMPSLVCYLLYWKGYYNIYVCCNLNSPDHSRNGAERVAHGLVSEKELTKSIYNKYQYKKWQEARSK